MIPYKNLGGDSGIVSYKIGEDYIQLIFKNSTDIYQYSYCDAGQEHVEEMKNLAISGTGLNEYKNKYKPEFIKL